ncbi:putative 2-aminoethylphosphonate ABC transporter ATP-binding protein [Pseudothauera lacus]|uniref:Putative 2-aminoethylphosphonate ABC transporter ATP-binding protein n=1 Tax=Pseudothauera lacus TaxID=2136175 RepID=A0A2T4IGL3_9RHOO|nr:putative 2-aminoethylphosphonate ABC transporter ATP-binding protein [Pseudothauera lacus]PTD96915.1 putative 2-aminoethylphosphonate ABC transporter ATP-binding protein [Pseudothauera lacus]
MSYLLIEALSKRFGRFTALDRVDLSIERGEFVVFLGPSGCGKTTLLRAIAGLDRQDSGRIVQDGDDISQWPVAARDFGIVFQSYALFPNLSVADNIAYGLDNRRFDRSARARRVEELLQLVGLPGIQGKYPAQLSGGQQQRVALARALATAPGLLLLDEPLSALDALERVRLRGEIRALQDKLGVTTVMVTHDQEEALAVADRIVVMSHGRIEQVGTPREVYRAPATPFVADFIGRVNVLDGAVHERGRVQVGPHVLDCEQARDLSPGAAVRLYLRPEDITLLGVTDSAPNSFYAHVRKVEFLGAHVAVVMKPDRMEGVELTAQFSQNYLNGTELPPGAIVRVGVDRRHLRVIAGEG